jgi:hypothetical protein
MPWEIGDDPHYAPAITELKTWVDAPLIMQRARGTQLHSLIDDWRSNKLFRPRPAQDEDFDAHTARLLSPDFQVFVVEHDWATAFEGSSEFAKKPGTEFDFRMPYPHCCFEFFISGKRVCFLTHFDDENYRIAAYVRLEKTWLQPPLAWAEFRPLASVLDAQFRAIGIALEAEVATSEIVRASYKLNRAKERRGRAPIKDYHIVKLQRSRPLPLPSPSDEKSRSVRLHFRRGHWRHFENHKTWIKWTLVGDPDLGFIEKHYSL